MNLPKGCENELSSFIEMHAGELDAAKERLAVVRADRDVSTAGSAVIMPAIPEVLTRRTFIHGKAILDDKVRHIPIF